MSGKKGKGKSQNFQRKPKKASKSLTGSKPSTKVVRVPVAKSYVQRNSTALTHQGTTYSKEFGTGIRFSGEQMLFPINSSAAADAYLFGTGTATVVDGSHMDLSPDYLNGRLALIASGYDRYRFRRVTFKYNPTVATTTSDGMCLAFIADPAFSGTMNYVTAQEVVPSVTTAFREPVTLTYTYDGDLCWFCKGNVSTDSLARQTCQGELFGFRSTNSGGFLNEGNLRISYEIEFYQPTPTLGLVLTGLSAEEYKVASAILGKSRQVTRRTDRFGAVEDSKESSERPLLRTSTVQSGSSSSSSSGVLGNKVDDQYVYVRKS